MVKAEAKIKANPSAKKLFEKLAAEDVKDFADLVLYYSRDATPVLTGNLKRSLEQKVVSPMQIELRTRTGKPGKPGYGAHVHFGTKRMAARPFFAQGTDAAVGPMEDLIRKKAKNRG